MDKQMKMHYMQRIDEKLSDLPWYVTEFIDSKKRTLSPTTLLNYCHDYIIFFDWLIAENLTSSIRKEIHLETLERLTIREVENFLSFLDYQLGNKKLTINRKLSSLKSLFDYLQNKAETSDLKPYIQRNVMAKMDLNAVKESQETIANRIEGKILREDDFELFRQFVAYDFGEKYKDNKRIYTFHQFNRERDTAIVSLILGSGLRLSEVAGINMDDLDMNKALVRVIRKGDKEQYVYFSKQALLDLESYLQIRETRYVPEKLENYLFIAAPVGRKGKSRRLTQRSIEKLIEKYAAAFGKPSLTVHSLRHSFATRYHLENNDVPKLKNQLGHSSIQTTMIYTHLTDEEMRNAVNNMDR
ncbi:tyrosine recombinase XerS [Paenibacillus riograndensis]|uniref:Site-specific tyrosine recombinase XerS n=1 Tax=Paenibacillus riograndensis SBR5 TaxID=1073571 RepID=A0A0E4HEC4_9BACL|nr:tyrosine recombinase XerS [Paenibacillus riograndensis]CQR55940.1 site-specific tyrosine recombinase XerS [Paenibacillus riograndensis SBR5]